MLSQRANGRWWWWRLGWLRAEQCPLVCSATDELVDLWRRGRRHRQLCRYRNRMLLRWRFCKRGDRGRGRNNFVRVLWQVRWRCRNRADAEATANRGRRCHLRALLGRCCRKTVVKASGFDYPAVMQHPGEEDKQNGKGRTEGQRRPGCEDEARDAKEQKRHSAHHQHPEWQRNVEAAFTWLRMPVMPAYCKETDRNYGNRKCV